MIRFQDGSGDPKVLTVGKETGIDGKRYVEFEMGTENCIHSFWLSDLDTMELIEFLQLSLGLSTTTNTARKAK